MLNGLQMRSGNWAFPPTCFEEWESRLLIILFVKRNCCNDDDTLNQSLNELTDSQSNEKVGRYAQQQHTT